MRLYRLVLLIRVQALDFYFPLILQLLVNLPKTAQLHSRTLKAFVMLPLSPKILLLILASLTFTTALHPRVIPQLSVRQNTVELNVTRVAPHISRFNGYDIIDCGSPQDPKSKTNLILGFLFQMKPQLERIIADARLGTHSKHGYTAFFKSNRNIGKVIAVFQKLLDAFPIIVDEDRVPLTAERIRTPKPGLLCLNETDVKNAPFLRACNESPQNDKPLVLIWPGTEIMVMCPKFFTVKQYPITGTCPELENGKFKSGDGKLLFSAFAYVVYALVNIYDRGIMGDWTDKWDMQYAVKLNSRQSLRSAENYAYYAGGMFGLLVYL